MKIEDIKKMAQAWNQVQEASYGKKKEAMDPVDAKELKGKHKDRKDKDINNDGDVDKSDEYLHKRRKAVSKAIKGKETETEVQTQESVELDEAVHTVEIDHEGDQDPDAFKHKITLKHGGGAGGTTATGKKKNLQKYLTKHYVSRSYAKDVHPEVFESVELDELSKKTLGSYINKSHKDYDKQRTKQGAAYDKAARTGRDDDEDKGHEYGRKADQRTKGIKTAVNKLTKESVELDELSKKTLGSYIKKADKQADKAADSYSNAAMRRSDFAPDTPAMAKNAKKFAKRDTGADLARRKLAKEAEDTRMGTITVTSDDERKKRAAAYRAKKEDLDLGEAKDHGNMNNGSPRGEGLSPSAKKELARTTPMPDAVNEPMVDKKTFDAIRASGKKAPMRSNDNAAGEKNIKPSATQVKEDMDKIHTVDIDHMGGHDANAKKHNITLKKTKATDYSHNASGKKQDLQKYLAKHYGDARDAKELHPEVH